MQAIISDIIVNQAVQSGNLQVSQLTQNDSSPQTSFIDMLNSMRSQESELPENEKALKTSYDDKKPQEAAESAENQKVQNAEHTEEKKDTDEVKDSADKKEAPKTEDKKPVKEESVKKVSLQKDDQNKPKLLNSKDLQVKDVKADANGEKLEKVQTKLDAKNTKVEADKKLELNQNEKEVTAADKLVQNAGLIQNASSINGEKSNLNVKAENSDKNVVDEIEVQDIGVSQNQNELLQNKLTADEKVYALDKDSKIIVHDQRTEQSEDVKPAEKNNAKNQLQVQYDNQNNATITMELDQQAVSENILSLDNQTAASDGSNFQAMLNNQIQANAPEFVKAGSLILQDNNKGTINLVLHPDDLGNVKIHLSMDGKTVSAHITVNTKEALEVFKDNAQTLREAFAKNGYDTANFDVSYNGNSQSGQEHSFEGMYDGTEYWARKTYSNSLGGENDGYIPDSYEFAQNSEYSINIVA